jgi:hypothetical protein
MIKLFLYTNSGSLNEYFQEEDFNIPFLGNTLFDFVVSSYKNLADSVNVDFEVYVPEYVVMENSVVKTYKNIPQCLSENRDVIFISDVFSIPVFEFSKDDYFFLKQNPDNFFNHSSGVKMGYMSSESKFVFSENELTGFNNLVRVNEKNFLSLNQKLINNFKGVYYPGFYGEPIVLANKDNIFNSKICAPCFIGADVRITNSTIYPGTILTGRTIIQNSEVFESYLCQSSVKNSAIKNSLVVLSDLEGVTLNNSVAPAGSILLNDRNR